MAEESKTEKATPKKRNDERKKGHVSLSKDTVSVVTLLVGVIALRVWFPTTVMELRQYFQLCFAQMNREIPLDQIPPELLEETVMVTVRAALPILLLVGLAAVAATFAQTRMLVSWELIRPKLSKLNPIEGFKRLFSLKSVIEALKSLLKITILLYFIYDSLMDLLRYVQAYMLADPTGSSAHLLQLIFTMLLKISVVFAILAAVDFGYQRWDFEREMRMTKQEVKEEFKQIEGDPQIKGKIRELQRRMAQSRMMQQVPQADVIIRNPTHFAVALRYHPDEDEAPVVLAKGQDELAQRIVRVGEEADVTVIENVPLARALYADAELNRQIPPNLYEAVAEVMVYLYKLGKLKGKGEGSAPLSD